MRSQSYLLIVTVLLAGCGNLVSQKRGDVLLQNTTELPGKVITQPAQLRNVYIKTPTEQPAYISCAEPAPDAALSDTFKLIAGVTQDVSTDASSADLAAKAAKKLAVNSDFQTSTAALELAGRTQLVLLARELLFRACESASNKWLTPTEVKDTHVKVIDALVKMTDAAKSSAEAKAVDAKTANDALQLDMKVISATNTRFLDNSRTECLAEYDKCGKSANGDSSKEQACRASFLSCVK